MIMVAPQGTAPEIYGTKSGAEKESKLLNAEQEIFLTELVQDGLRTERKYTEEEIDAGAISEIDQQQIMSGKAAERRMVLANKGLVHFTLRRFEPVGILDQDDLTQVAFMGLIKAIRSFSREREVRFSTFAVKSMEWEISRERTQHFNGLRYPAHIGQEISRYLAIFGKLEQETGLQPDITEIAAVSGLHRAQLEAAKRNKLRIIPVESGEGFGTSREYTDTDGQPRLKQDISWQLVSDDDPAEQARRTLDSEQIYMQLIEGANLSDREKMIIEMRFGLVEGSGEGYTQEQVGRALGLTGGRIGQIESNAIAKMRGQAIRGQLNPGSITVSDEELDYQSRVNPLVRWRTRAFSKLGPEQVKQLDAETRLIYSVHRFASLYSEKDQSILLASVLGLIKDTGFNKVMDSIDQLEKARKRRKSAKPLEQIVVSGDEGKVIIKKAIISYKQEILKLAHNREAMTMLMEKINRATEKHGKARTFNYIYSQFKVK